MGIRKLSKRLTTIVLRVFSRRNSIVFAILWALLIFLLSHSPNTDDGTGILVRIITWVASWLPFELDAVAGLDKIVHAVFYGIFAFFIFGASRRYVLSLVIASLYGVTDEFHQSFIEGRDADVWDWVADTVGASLALFAIAFMGVFFQKKKSDVTAPNTRYT